MPKKRNNIAEIREGDNSNILYKETISTIMILISKGAEASTVVVGNYGNYSSPKTLIALEILMRAIQGRRISGANTEISEKIKSVKRRDKPDGQDFLKVRRLGEMFSVTCCEHGEGMAEDGWNKIYIPYTRSFRFGEAILGKSPELKIALEELMVGMKADEARHSFEPWEFAGDVEQK